jgi:hypothetical protein
MDYLSNFYRNKCERLEEQKNILINNLSEIFETNEFNFRNWLSNVVSQQASQTPLNANHSSGELVDTPMYSKQATDIMQALSDPRHPMHQSPFMKEMMFGMLTSMGVNQAHIKNLKSLPHNRNISSTDSQP